MGFLDMGLLGLGRADEDLAVARLLLRGSPSGGVTPQAEAISTGPFAVDVTSAAGNAK